MRATRVRIRKRRLHRVSRCRVRYRAAMADPSRAATMSSTCTGASCSRTSSNSAAAPTATAAPTAAATTAPAAISEQRAGRCDQQCLDGNYCKKLGYPRHDALLIRTQSDPMFHAARWL
jgi:hypothetical protein